MTRNAHATGGAFGYSAICAVCPPTFTPGGDASAWLKLERLEAPYIIVPCARDPGHEGIFALRVRSNFAVRLRLLPSKASDNAAALAALEDEFELDQSTEGEPITEAAMKQPLALEMPATTDAAVDRVLRSLRGHDGLFKDETTETLLAPPSNAPLLVRWRRPSQLQWQQEGQPSLPFGASPTPVFLSPAPIVPANLPSWGESSAPSSTPPSAEDTAAGSWLLGALAILAQRPEVVDRCFVQGSHLQRGVLAVRVWDWNRWRTIVTGAPACRKSNKALPAWQTEDSRAEPRKCRGRSCDSAGPCLHFERWEALAGRHGLFSGVVVCSQAACYCSSKQVRRLKPAQSEDTDGRPILVCTSSKLLKNLPRFSLYDPLSPDRTLDCRLGLSLTLRRAFFCARLSHSDSGSPLLSSSLCNLS
eukprot:6198248-Pleurochrysis_carterae.AAC.2